MGLAADANMGRATRKIRTPLRDYGALVAKRFWLILLTAAVTALCAYLFGLLQTPVYRATVHLNVWPARLDWGLQQTIQGLMRSYAGNITSRETAFEVVNRLQLDITPEEMIAKLNVQPIEEDYLLQIEADDYDPFIARDIAQTTAEVFVEDIKVYMLEQDERDRVEINIRDAALPGELHKPNWRLSLLVGGGLGLLLGVALAIVVSRWEMETIRSSRDLERWGGVAVLGTIPARPPDHI